MKQLLNIPHRTGHDTCPANGIHDLVHWHTSRDWSNEFLWDLGQGGAFAYLRFNAADPRGRRTRAFQLPASIFWQNCSRRISPKAKIARSGHSREKRSRHYMGGCLRCSVRWICSIGKTMSNAMPALPALITAHREPSKSSRNSRSAPIQM